MAVTKVADVIVPEVFNDYFLENSIYKSAVWRSGIVSTNPQFGALLQGGARQFEMPFWRSNLVIDADASSVKEDDVLAPTAITSTQMTARRQFREKAFGQNDLAAVLAGDSPMEAILQLTEQFWNRNYQKFLFASVRGVIADNVANNAGDLRNNHVGDIDSDEVIDTIALFGDADEDLAAIAMHSVPYNTLRKANLIDFRPDNEQNIGWGTYLGKTVIVDDMLVDTTATPDEYWNILFKPGAFGFAEVLGPHYEPTEVQRNPAISGGQSVYFTRRVFLMHPNGMRWSDPGTPTHDFPTNTELMAAGNWERVVAGPKNCGFAVLVTTG